MTVTITENVSKAALNLLLILILLLLLLSKPITRKAAARPITSLEQADAALFGGKRKAGAG